MKKLLILLLLAGCAPTPDAERVGPNTMWLELHEVADIDQIAAQYGVEPPSGSQHEGFAVLSQRGEDSICRIYIHPFSAPRDSVGDLLGHELMHCIFGDYH